MSASGREVAHRIFAAEYDEATYSYSESDEERAPNYVVTPTGARVNRLFFVGVLTEVEQVSDDVLRARVADPTGAFVVYAGQYQPDEMAFLEEADPPMFVAVTGKARTFSPDDSDRVFTSVRPESINAVDADTRDRWTVEAAEATLARVATFAAALDSGLSGDDLRTALRESGATEGLAAGIPIAREEYGTTEHYLSAVADLARDALELVAGTTDEVEPLSITPADAGDGTVDAAALASAVDGAVADVERPEGSDGPDGPDPGESDPVVDSSSDASSTTDAPPEPDDDAGDELGDFEPGGGASDDQEIDEPDDDAPAETTDGAAAGTTDDAPDQTATDDSVEATDDDSAEATVDPAAGTTDDTPDDAPDDVLDEDERERIEEEYGTDFSTGSEVGEPGEAGIEPEAGPIEPDESGEDETEPATETDAPGASTADAGGSEADETGTTDEAADSTDEPAGETGEAADTAEDAGDVDLEAAVLDAMADLDEGDGADREAVVAAVVDEHGVDPGAAEEAIQDALMAGKCYEPTDETVKPI